MNKQSIKSFSWLFIFGLIFACKTAFQSEIILLESYIIELQHDDLKKSLEQITDYDLRDQKIYQYLEDTFYMINPKHITHAYNETFIGFSAYISQKKAKSFEKLNVIKSISRVDVDKKKEALSHKKLNQTKLFKPSTHQINVSNHTVSTTKKAWVIDSGIANHQDLNIDKKLSRNFIANIKKKKIHSSYDHNGHGTHVAGIIAGKHTGQTPGAIVVAIKITNEQGKGNITDALKGLDYAAFQGKKGDVVNMSINGPYYAIFEKAVLHTAKKNIYVVLAAGNDGKKIIAKETLTGIFDVQNVYVVLNQNQNDKKQTLAESSNYASYSNCYAAPGENIFSTWNNNQHMALSGTSMAAPYISGLLLKHGSYFPQKEEIFNHPKFPRETIKIKCIV